MIRPDVADLPRIYFDSNAATEDGRYILSIAGSLKDIRSLGDSLRPGMRVLLYMTDELEVEATLELDGARQTWLGLPDDSTLRVLGESI